MVVNLKPKSIALVFAIGTAIVIALHVLGYFSMYFANRPHPPEWFNVDSEANLPTMYNTALLLCSGLFLTLIAYMVYKGEGKSFPWWILAMVFFALGMDETIKIHEKVSEVVQGRFDTSGVFQYAWVIPYGIAFIVFVMIMLKFFLSLPAETRKWLLVGGIIYVGGALGLEMAASSIYTWGERGHLYYVFATIEETMEMSGAVVFIYAFCNHIDKYLPDFTLSITSE